MKQFEEQLHQDLHQFLQSMKDIGMAYVSCLRQLYLFGAAMQFFDERSGKAERKRMGYHMTKMN